MQNFDFSLFVIFTIGVATTVNANCRLTEQELDLTSSSGIITTPNYNRTYPYNQRCTWKFNADPLNILVLQFNDLQTGDQSIWCGNDYIRLPNGLRICGNSKPKNCYAFASENMMLSGCVSQRMPHCGCNTQIFSLRDWPPTLLFRSDRRQNYRGAAINYTFIKCPKDTEMIPSSTIEQEVTETDRVELTAFTATSILSGILLVLVFILMIIIIQLKSRNRAMRRRLPTTKSSATPNVRQAPKEHPPATPLGTSGTNNTSYVNSPTNTETGSIHYDYIDPVSSEKNQYEKPICHKPVYVELQ